MKLVRVIKKGDADIGDILDKLAKSAEVVESSSNSSWNKIIKQYQTFKKIEDFLGDQDKDKLRRLSARIRDAIGQTEALFNDLKKYEQTVDDNWR